MAFLSLILFLGIVWCSTASAKFTKLATRFSKVAAAPDTIFGAYLRSSNVAALSLLEQEKLKEARETLAQTALTLALLDIGGGAVLPVAEEITEYVKSKPQFAGTRKAFENYNKVISDEAAKATSDNVDKSAIRKAKQALKNALKVDADKFPRLSKVGKAFTKASKWLKGASLFDVLGPITDTISIGLNIWGLEMAIRDNNPHGIAAASLSIAAGVIGVGTFIAAVATGTAVLGPIGAVVGAILGMAATLVELLGNSGYDKQAVEEYRARLKHLRNLRDACIGQIDKRMEFLDKVGSPYTDVYVNNQAASVAEAVHGSLDMCDCYYSRRDPSIKCPEFCTKFKTSLNLRRSSYAKPEDLKEVLKELRSRSTAVRFIGDYRGIFSPIIPLASSHTGWGTEIGKVGFEFYGKYKKGTPYKGVHVFVNAEFVSEEELNGVYINTDLPENVEQNDVISIGDYKKLGKSSKIVIQTGKGNDCLNINGMIGEFHSNYENRLETFLGCGWNVLSFQGLSKDRNDIKGVFFNSKTGDVKYYYGQPRKTHKLGTVIRAFLFHGSPFDDYVILSPYKECEGENEGRFTVVQTAGKNVYEFDFDFDDFPHGAHRKSYYFFQIIDKSNEPPKINFKSKDTRKINHKRIKLYRKKLLIFGLGGYPQFSIEIMLETKTTGKLFINNANPRPIDYAHINPWPHGDNEIINFTFPAFSRNHFTDADELLLLKWQADQAHSSIRYVVDMKGGNNIVLIGDKYFLEPCGIDGETVTLTLKKGSITGACTISIEKLGDPNFAINLELRNVERIINEYGDQVVYLPTVTTVPMDLYDKYLETTRDFLNIKTTEDKIEED